MGQSISEQTSNLNKDRQSVPEKETDLVSSRSVF